MDLIHLLQNPAFWNNASAVFWAFIVGIGTYIARKFGKKIVTNKQAIATVQEKAVTLENIVEENVTMKSAVAALTAENIGLKIQNKALNDELTRSNDTYDNLVELYKLTKQELDSYRTWGTHVPTSKALDVYNAEEKHDDSQHNNGPQP